MSAEIASLIEAGLIAHCAGDNLTAALSYARALGRSPNHMAANLLLSAIAQDAGDWAAAKDLGERAGGQPDGRRLLNADGLAALARMHLGRGRPDVAMAALINLDQLRHRPDLSSLRASIKAEQDKLLGPPPADALTRDLLIVCPTHVRSPDKIALLNFWRAAVERFNPGIDWLMVDDGSPPAQLEAAGLGPDVARVTISGTEPEAIPLTGARTFASFRGNIGHYLTHGNDGGLRSVATGMKTALANGCRYIAVLEMDVYTRLDLRKLVGQMRSSGAKAMTARVKPWNFIETGFMLLDVAHLAAIRCVERWPWQKVCLVPQIEWICEAVLGDVTIMPWTGGRNDFNKFAPETIAGLSYITHCHDASLYRRYIEEASPALEG